MRILAKYANLDPGFRGTGVEGVKLGQNLVRDRVLLASKTPEGKVHNDPKRFADRTDERNRRYGGN